MEAISRWGRPDDDDVVVLLRGEEVVYVDELPGGLDVLGEGPDRGPPLYIIIYHGKREHYPHPVP